MHRKDIASFLLALKHSNDIHALIIEGPPGIGKTTTVLEEGGKLQLPIVKVGSYTSPLALFKAMQKHRKEVLVFDDTHGLFESDVSVANMKAATAQVGDQKRTVVWRSTTAKIRQSKFDFEGKVVIIANSIQERSALSSLFDRALHYRIEMSEDEYLKLLEDSVESLKRDPLAIEVVEFIRQQYARGRIKMEDLSFRLVHRGYALASTGNKSWRDLFMRSLPRKPSIEVATELLQSGLKTVQQEREFRRKTGLGARTFYYYRNMALKEQETQRGAR